jgi:hypothetical protein
VKVERERFDSLSTDTSDDMKLALSSDKVTVDMKRVFD